MTVLDLYESGIYFIYPLFFFTLILPLPVFVICSRYILHGNLVLVTQHSFPGTKGIELFVFWMICYVY